MKTILVTFILAILSLGGQTAEAQSCLAGVAGAVPDDTVSVSISVTGPTSDDDTLVMESGRKKGNSGQIAWELVFWNTQEGPAITVDPASIIFSGDGEAINALSVPTIFDLISRTSIAQAIARGDIPCTNVCGQVTVSVYQPACVERQGVGIGTQLVSCDLSACCKRSFSVCCPDGSEFPQIEQINSSSPGCAAVNPACLPTCP